MIVELADNVLASSSDLSFEEVFIDRTLAKSGGGAVIEVVVYVIGDCPKCTSTIGTVHDVISHKLQQNSNKNN